MPVVSRDQARRGFNRLLSAVRAPSVLSRVRGLSLGGQSWQANRRNVASSFLRGSGVEVGALHEPLPVPLRARVRYVDRMSAADLRRQYPELADKPIVDPDVVEDGESLPSIADGSLDFLIANHFIEHCQDPLHCLSTFTRVVRPGGVVYLAVPDKRFTFDETREITPFEHIARDFEEGPAWSRRGHFEEVVRTTEKRVGPEAEARLEELLAMDYSIHYHVWDHHAFTAFLCAAAARYSLPYEIAFALRNGMESIFLLQRT